MKSLSLEPIGHVRSTRKNPLDDNWDSEESSIELDPAQFSEEALLGLSEYSHAEIIFYMDKVDPSKIQKAARHPRITSPGPWLEFLPNEVKTVPIKLEQQSARS